MMTATEASFDNAGIRIFYRAWEPAGEPKAVVVLCHGFNSHGGQYVWAADQLAAQGFAVLAPDLRGRGQSGGERFYVEHVEEYVSDLAGAIAIAKGKHPGKKLFLLGHSAGGVTGASYVLDHPGEIDGFVCESFAFEVPAPSFVLTVIKWISAVLPRLKVLKLPNIAFSRDPAVVAALDADPLIKDETQPAITVAALVRANERLRRDFPTVTLPLLILHGTQDKATLPSGSEFFHATAGSADKTLKLYEGHFHDLLADYGKEAVMGDIVTWIEARV